MKKKITADNFFDELEAFKETVSAKTIRYKQYITVMATSVTRINTALKPAFFSEDRSLFYVVGENDKLINKTAKQT